MACASGDAVMTPVMAGVGGNCDNTELVCIEALESLRRTHRALGALVGHLVIRGQAADPISVRAAIIAANMKKLYGMVSEFANELQAEDRRRFYRKLASEPRPAV